MTRAVLSLGSNLGDRAGHLRAAMAALDEYVMAVSGVYETEPWGGPGPDGQEAPPYLNAVVLVVDDGDDPHAWLTRARELEHAAGRERDPEWRYAPRTLDVDVITVWTADGAAVLAPSTKARIDRKDGTEPVNPLTVAWYVVLAKASALGGALFTGLYAGLLVWLVPQSGSIAHASRDLPQAIVGLIGAFGLTL